MAQRLAFARGYKIGDRVRLSLSKPSPCYHLDGKTGAIDHIIEVHRTGEYTGPVFFVIVDEWGSEYPIRPDELSHL